MTDSQAFLERITQLSPKRLALLALELQTKLDAQSAQRTEPIAIVGMGCRLPGGADTPDAYWRLLRDGVDAIREVPADRWDAAALYNADADAPGTIATRWGGFLDGIDQFDPAFFGISPREAASMDPQQRLLLEVGWEALENAGYAPDGLAETPTGVFVGVCNGDYYQMLMDGDASAIDAYVATGSAHSVASGRLSYLLGLRGPSLSVDTACSSSLVAVHLASQSLRSGECRVALAGGVNVVLTPRTTMALSRAHMMASDGRCKAFDEAADGFVRSEGCGIVVLKRLSDAVADGDRVLALIRGSATNQDGRSNGLTAPNGPSQVAVIREALANAGVEAADVGYVETHGTGTSLGDPIEAQALGAALGSNRPSGRPVLIGSAKTNLGHLESAAGVAGLIKAVLTLQRAEVPRMLHFQQPSRHIPWAELPLRVPTEHTPWLTQDGKARIAGVSSFGFSGTNAHVVLQEAPTLPVRDQGASVRTRALLTLSAGSPASLRELAARYIKRFEEEPTLDLPATARAASLGRAQLGHRLAIVASDASGARAALTDWLAEKDAVGVCSGQLDASAAPRVAFLFPGQGAQYTGMGKVLYDSEPAFRAALDECAELLRPYLDRPLLSVMWAASHGQPSDVGSLDRTRYTQPATFAIEYALAQLWLSWGIRPTAMLGHSVGEYAAACVAGVFSLADALRLVAARGRLMDALPADGAMASVRASETLVRRALVRHASDVSIAALNGPDSIVISGGESSVEAVLAELAMDGVETRRLAISVAAHSPRMDPMLDAFERIASEVCYSPPHYDIVSGMTGRLATSADLCDPTYWRRHVREAVRFADGVSTLTEQGCRVLLEVGPTPILLNMAERCAPAADLCLVSSLRRATDDWQSLLEGLGRLWARGVGVDWRAVHAGATEAPVSLPATPFDRTRCWAPRKFKARPHATGSQSLLGAPLESPAVPVGTRVFESVVHAEHPTFIQDHRIHGLLVLPSPVYVDMALSAADERWGPCSHALEEFAIDEALIVPEDGERIVHLVLADDGDDAAAFTVYSRPVGKTESAWTRHAAGRLRNAATLPAAPEPRPALPLVQAANSSEVDVTAYYARLRDLGLDFGPRFRGTTRIWRDGVLGALGQVDLPAPLTAEASVSHIHPALLDACFHVLGAPLSDQTSRDASFLLVGIDRLRLYAPPTPRVWDHVVVREASVENQSAFSADVILYNATGDVIGEIGGVHLRRVDAAALVRVTDQAHGEWIYDVAWRAANGHQHQPSLGRLASPSTIAAAVEELVPQTVSRHGLSVYADLLPELERLAGAYVASACVSLGWQPRRGDFVSTDQLVQDLGVCDAQRRLFARLLEMLAEDGYLTRSPAGWRIERALAAEPDVDTWAARLRSQYPAAAAEVRLTERCGAHLAGVLRGSVDPLQVLFPDGSVELTEPVYVDSPFARVYNTLAAEAAAAIAASAADRPLRILEIGGGTGATTRAILAALAAHGKACHYTFTDVSPLFVARAEEHYRGDPRVTCRTLDVESDPIAQGFSSQAYDVVVAANVLHATADLADSVSNARTLLAPGGLLLLLEGTARQRWVDLTFGLTAGWWKFNDPDLRPNSPLLTATAWTDLLFSLGLEQPQATIAGDTRQADLAHQALIVARAPAQKRGGEWLVLTDAGGIGTALVDLLRERGERVCAIARAEIGAPDELRDRVAALSAAGGGHLRVVYLWPLDASATTTDELERSVGDLASCATALLRGISSDSTPARLWFATRGAQIAADGETGPVLAEVPLWGLGRVISLEHPDQWAASIDLDPNNTPLEAAVALLGEIDGDAADGEDQVVLRGGERLVPRLVRRAGWRPRPTIISAEGTHLITGGLGGLGLKIAQWLVDRGARHVTLLGRTGLPPRAEWPTLPVDSRQRAQTEAIEALEVLGASVEVIAGDVADESAMTQLFSRFGGDLPPLRGMVHAAAALGGAPLRDLSDELLHAALRPKVRGTWVLHELTRALPLDYFVLFSSTTALWGSSGLGHYAAANSFLDGFAHLRRSLGLPALSVNWGTWDEMRVASAADRSQIAQFGLQPMPARQALDTLGGLLALDEPPQVAVAAVDWPVLKTAYGARRSRPFFAEVGDPPRTRPETVVSATVPELLERVTAAASAERSEIVLAYVQSQVVRVLGIDPTQVLDPAQGLFNLGMDSLMSVELKSRLERATGRTLPSTLTFNYPNINALASYLADEVLANAEPAGDGAGPMTGDELAELSEDGAAMVTGDELAEQSEDDLADLLAARLAGLR